MARLNEISEDDLQNVFKQAEFGGETASGSVQLSPALLEKLGMNPSNKTGGRKAINVDKALLEKLGLNPANKTGGRKAANVDKASDFIGRSASKPVQRRPEEKRNKKSFLLLREKARALASRSMYYEASSLLEEVDDNEQISDLGTRLLMAECYLQLGRENRANKCLKNVEKSLTSKPLLSNEELMNLAKDFIGGSSFIRAIIVLRIAADCILQGSAKPDDMLSGVYQCYSKLDEAVKAMLKKGDRNRAIAADMGMESMMDIYEKIRKIEGCDRDKQVLRESSCCRRLDYNFSLLNDRKKCVEIATRAIKNLEDHFTPVGAQRFQVYGWLLHNLGVTLSNSQKFQESLAIYQKALEAKEQATDYQNESLKKRDIDQTKEGMKLVRSAIGKI